MNEEKKEQNNEDKATSFNKNNDECNDEIQVAADDQGMNQEFDSEVKQIINSKYLVKIERLESEKLKFEDLFLRAKAEMENLRKRNEREIRESSQYAISEFAKDLVEVLENLYRAKSYITDDEGVNEKFKGFIDGIDMTIKVFDNTLTKHGIKRIMPKDEIFDHRYHQAISQIQNEELEENTVVEVIQPGYLIQDRLLKPALVIVSSKP